MLQLRTKAVYPSSTRPSGIPDTAIAGVDHFLYLAGRIEALSTGVASLLFTRARIPKISLTTCALPEFFHERITCDLSASAASHDIQISAFGILGMQRPHRRLANHRLGVPGSVGRSAFSLTPRPADSQHYLATFSLLFVRTRPSRLVVDLNDAYEPVCPCMDLHN